MTLKRLRQILKALAEDTRLRIVNILQYKELTVKDICTILRVKQPTISKHLVRLRLLRIVRDRREGNYVYYGLFRDSGNGKIARSILSKFKNLEVFKHDLAKIRSLRRNRAKR